MSARILAIDDEVDMLSLIRLILTEKTDYEITTTNNPLEVSNLIKEKKFDVIVTDLKMPIMDGMDVVDAIRKQDALVPIIIITAYGSVESAEEAVRKGAFDYITKPFRQEQLLISLKRALEWYALKKEYLELREKFLKSQEAEQL
ncbi:MAG: response regulator [Thermodesulfobacteriota bacterium]|jgi:DNA-binding NtrC family response regulator|nr:MAG: response regulator [Thermodesulfobacteriota bacterium]